MALEGTPTFHYATSAWLAVAFLGAFNSGLVFIAWTFLVRRYGATRVSAFMFIQPISAYFFGRVLLNERVSWIAAVGVALTSLGVYRVATRAAKPAK
jgi:drug/metabolite transporter (DMT)-like permease